MRSTEELQEIFQKIGLDQQSSKWYATETCDNNEPYLESFLFLDALKDGRTTKDLLTARLEVEQADRSPLKRIIDSGASLDDVFMLLRECESEIITYMLSRLEDPALPEQFEDISWKLCACNIVDEEDDGIPIFEADPEKHMASLYRLFPKLNYNVR